jgi:hypothetical protein
LLSWEEEVERVSENSNGLMSAVGGKLQEETFETTINDTSRIPAAED